MRDYLFAPQPMHAIIAQVAEKHGLTYREMLARRRARKIAWARQEAMWRCARETTESLPNIGRALGGYDHTTVLYGVRRHEERMSATT